MYNSRFLMTFVLALIVSSCSHGQHGTPDTHDSHDMHMPGMQMPDTQGTPGILMGTNPVGIPLSRFASGTSWLPDSTPMYGVMQHSEKWNLMYHGAAFLAYDKMNGPRGNQKVVLPNWVMATGQRSLGLRSDLRLTAMLSLDPLTVGGSGYPLLFQTGETWRGQKLKDHQHPHNFFSELSAYYTRAVTRRSAAFVYFAPVGEPAFGPVTYMHRTFALDNPLAPIGHHWQDATHITYWVATLGYETHEWKLDSSSFNGREPGENRFSFQSPRFDSFSGRISFNPTADLALQASHAYLHSPEASDPDEDIHRTSASVTYNRPLGPRRNFQTTFVWARNRVSGLNLDSYLVEAQLRHDRGWTPFFRYELVRKNAHELVLPSTFTSDQAFDLRQTTLGVTRQIFTTGGLSWALGGEILLNTVPAGLRSVYGDDPTGWLLFIRAHPTRMSH